MVRREIRRAWTQQPQEAVRPDMSHPLTRCLQHLWLPTSEQPIDLISGTQSAHNAPGITLGLTERGPAILGQSDAAGSFALRTRPAYPSVIVSYGWMNVNNGFYFLNCGSMGNYALLSVTGLGATGLSLSRNYGTHRSVVAPTTRPPGALRCTIAVIYSGTDYRLFADGEKATGTASFGTATGPWMQNLAPVGATCPGGVHLLGVGSGIDAPDDDTALEISANPSLLWQMLEPRRIWVPRAGAAPALPTLSLPTLVNAGGNTYQPRVTYTY